jgi:hypothetical protein
MSTPDATAREFLPPDLAATPAPTPASPVASAPREIGGPAGPEPTRYGDWEKAGRCIDF